MSQLILFILLTIASWLLTTWLVSPNSPIRILDHPNHRSLHASATPRTGGLAIVLCLVIGWIVSSIYFGAIPGGRWNLIAIALVAGCSLVDDFRELSVGVRLIFHLLAVACLIAGDIGLRELNFAGHQMPLPLLAALALTTLAVVWSINLYNFMDGMDGFAAGMTITGFGALGLAAWLQGDAAYAAVCGVLVASTLGFWFYNFPPAKIFMGDTGSSVLGLCMAILSLAGIRAGLFEFWVPLVIFSPFVVDATVTLIRRIFTGEKFWQAHKSHTYQRLVESGLGHKKVVLLEYGLMLVCATATLWLMRQSQNVQSVGLLLIVAMYTVLLLWIDLYLKKSVP